jgi:hypothetical protein
MSPGKIILRRKTNTREHTRKKNMITTIALYSYYRKLVKITIKTERLRWLKYIDDKLKTKPEDFWKYVSKFQKNDHVVTELKMVKM